MEHKLVIDYYTDTLCVWAWIAQRRVDELNKHFGDAIAWRYHSVNIFGDTAAKIERQWSDRGLYEGFGKHVLDSASAYEDAPVNPAIWAQIRPTTSANAHLFLKAVELSHSPKESIALALSLRTAFFVEAEDIGSYEILMKVSTSTGLDETKISQAIKDGSALAALMSDYQRANELAIKGSPSYVMDGGRQTLYGNVGYRVLQVNIEELLNNPTSEASWC